MAKVNQRLWKIPGQRAKRKAWGYTVQVKEDGKRVQKRCYKSEWTKEDAEQALAALLLGVEEAKPAAGGMTLAEAIERYVQAKRRKKSLANDKLYLAQLKAAFGAGTPLIEISAAKIAEWRDGRLAAVYPRTGRPYAPASVNRPLAALRTLLRLAHEEWGVLPAVPRIRLAKEPEGRVRWLEPDEEARLLATCAKSRNRELLPAVTIALESGMRRGELLGLTWDRVDLSRGVIRLEVTKSGKRREVPMRQVVYDALAGLPEPRQGRVFKTRSLRTAFENAAKEAGLDGLHFHDLRHHFASWFVMRGGSLQALREILGHADLKMTLRYAHLAPDHLRAEVAKTERAARPQPAEVLAQGSTQEAEDRG